MEQDLKFIIEAILFASDRCLTAEELKNAFDAEASVPEIKEALAQLADEYQAQGRGFILREIAGGWQILTHERFSSYLKKFYQAREKKRLTPASLETLSVVAYKQPVTKADIEFIRGVNVDGPLRTLLEKNLVKIVGRKEVPGRPILYGTTKEFLSHFGLNTVKELPPLSEFSEKDLDPSLLPPLLRYNDVLSSPDQAGDGLSQIKDEPQAHEGDPLVRGESSTHQSSQEDTAGEPREN